MLRVVSQALCPAGGLSFALVRPVHSALCRRLRAARTRPCRNSSVRARTVRNIRAPSEHHGTTGCRSTAASCHCCHGQQTGSPGTGDGAWPRMADARIAAQISAQLVGVEVFMPPSKYQNRTRRQKQPALPKQLTESRHVARAKLEPGGGGVRGEQVYAVVGVVELRVGHPVLRGADEVCPIRRRVERVVNEGSRCPGNPRSS